jgi:hypothetical protein
MADRVWKQLLVRVVPHTAYDTGDWQRIGYGLASSNGAAGGTTVIDTGFVSGSADTYNGRYWIEMLSGTCKGQWKRIVDDDGAGTYTLESQGFSAQIDSGDYYAIWKSPEPVIVCDGNTLSTTQCDDDYRDEDDDFWKDYWVMPITGNLRGEIKQISAFDKEGGANDGLFTFGAFTQAPASGDVMLLGKFIEVDIQTLPDGPEYIARAVNRVNYAVGDGALGGRGGEISFNSRVHGSGNLSAGDANARTCVLSPLFSAAGLEESIGTSCDIGAGSGTTTVKVDTGKWENTVIGQHVMYNGNIRRITGQTDGGGAVDTITVTPALPSAPIENDVLYGMRNYWKSTDASALYGCCIEVEIDGIRTIMTGLKGSMDVTQGDPVKIAWSFQIDHWTQEYEDAPYNPGVAYTTQPDVMGKDLMAWADASQIDVKGLTVSVGREVAARAVAGAYGANGRAGYHHTGYACGATYQEIMADGAELEAKNRYTARTARALDFVFGHSDNAIAISIPVAKHIGPATPAPGDGMVEAPNVLEAQDAGVTTNPDSTIVKIPDIVISIP